MEFWGVEVKAGQPIKCDPATDGKLLHLSQASLGEVKKDKGSDFVPLSVKVGDQKIVIGILSSEKCTHMSLDLVFEKEFELSHNWKHGSVYFCGYYTTIGEEDEEFSDSDYDSEGEHPLLGKENGNNEVKDEKLKPASIKANATKPESSDAKPKEKIVEPKKPNDDSDDEESDEEDSDDDEDMVEAGVESDDDDEDEDDSDDVSSDEDDATPKKVEMSKKRPVESATKTPIPEKKAKLVAQSGQKSGSDGKKGGHTATPYPSKQAGKPNTPKSGGQVTCKSCSKTFNSDNALQSHTKAKHEGK
ncbi:hypothetical protein MRB53_017989 [Persea americana]|uniref:Uncharacterized protein n=1 Tax=Persea americana TaxID=3435 RepID=A0ACC2M6P7_PERAE|nr:hypothetical protein MRB53_017989 [Persea americana]